MRLPTYPRHKPSGVEWLGDLPEHWESVALKRRFHIVNGGTPSSSEDTYWEGEIPWFTPEDLGRNETKVIASSRRQITKEGLANCSAKLSPRGSVLVSTRAPIGHVAVMGVDGCCNQGCRILATEGSRVSASFCFYVVIASNEVLKSVGKGTTFLELSGGALGAHWIPLPAPAEQRAIAAFLDQETGRMDQLVAKKRELVERLKEKRTALISRTVTRGLRNQNIQLLRLRRLLDGIDTGFTPDSYNFPAQEGQQGVLKSGCVNGGVFDSNENKLLADDVDPPAKLEVKIGDILMSRASGSSDLIGSVAQVREQPGARLYLSDKTFRLRVNKANCDEAFLVIVMGSNYLRSQVSQIISGAQGLAKNIAQSDMRELLVPSPPLDEQHAIATYLDRETSKIDRMLAKVEEAIERLQEYRTALITAAVTGKIDVRKVAA